MTYTMKDYIFEQDQVLYDVIVNGQSNVEEQLPHDLDINKVILVGSGTSLNAIISAKFAFNELLPYIVEATNPFDFINYYPKEKIDRSTLLIGVSQTARSTGVIDSIEVAKTQSARTLFVTANPNAEGAKRAEKAIYTWTGEEKVGPKTKGFTSTIATLYLIALALSGQTRDLSELPLLVKRSLQVTRETNEDFLNRFISANSLTLISYGPNMAAAHEGGLKISETVRIPVEVYNVEEYMHGPYHCLDEKSHLIFLASPGIGQPRINQLIEYAQRITHNIVVITDEKNLLKDRDSLVIRLDPDIDDYLSPMNYVIPLQLFAYELTHLRGRAPEASGHPDFHATLGSKQPVTEISKNR